MKESLYSFILKLSRTAGVAGIGLGVLLVIFREIISKLSWPILSSAHAYNLLNRITFFTFVCAALSLCFWFILKMYSLYLSRGRSNGSLQLVDANFEPSGEAFPRLDIKLRNTGDTAYVKRAEIFVSNVFEMWYSIQPYSVEQSWNYDALLPTSGAPYTVKVPLSQAIEGGKVDRFCITLGNNGCPLICNLRYLYITEIRLAYNEDNQVLKLPKIAFVARPPSKFVMYTRSGPTKLLTRDEKAFRVLRTYMGLCNEEMEEIRHSIANGNMETEVIHVSPEEEPMMAEGLQKQFREAEELMKKMGLELPNGLKKDTPNKTDSGDGK